jgi:uncharacterized repeat protein (TIGR01451 family)/CSLREA domain-containing protein
MALTSFNGSIVSDGFNLLGVPGPVTPQPTDRVGTSDAPLDPRLASLALRGGGTATHALLDDSPALDAAAPAAPGSGGIACETTDQRGRQRPGRGGAGCDIGAFERDLAEGADLTLGKFAGRAFAGDPLRFDITVANNGMAPGANVRVIDPIGAGITVLSIAPSQGACTHSGGTITCDLGAVAAGGIATVSATVVAPSGEWVNRATLIADPSSGVPASGIAASAEAVAQPPIVVTTTAQSPGAPGDCTLGEAIQAANTDRAVDGCRAGRGRDLIVLPQGILLMQTAYQRQRGFGVAAGDRPNRDPRPRLGSHGHRT